MTSWSVVHQAPLSMEFSRQEYWSESSFPPPGDLPNPGIEPRSPELQEDSLSAEPQGKPKNIGVDMLQEAGPLSGPKTGLLSNAWK